MDEAVGFAEILAVDQVVDHKRNLFHPANMTTQGHALNIITQNSGSPRMVGMAYYMLFQYLKKTEPKILLWRLSLNLVAFIINPEIHNWTLAEFTKMFKNNADLPKDLDIDLTKLFRFLQEYKFSSLDWMKSTKLELTLFEITSKGGTKRKKTRKKRKKRKQTRKKRKKRKQTRKKKYKSIKKGYK
jgi:hypothetical protein